MRLTRCSSQESESRSQTAKQGLNGSPMPAVERPRSKAWVLWFLMAVFLQTPSGLAQAKTEDKPAPKPPAAKAAPTPDVEIVQKVFEIKHADVERLAQVLNVFGGYISPNRELRVIGVRVPQGVLPAVEESIRRLDVPPPAPQNVELTAYQLLASDQETSDSSIPSDLEAVIKQLKATFSYKGFRSLDTVVVRSRNNQEGQVKGVARLTPSDRSYPVNYTFGYKAASILSDERGRSVRVDGLRLNAQVPVGRQVGDGRTDYHYTEAGFVTDVDIREGQKVVVGKATVDGSNQALILVITAKVLD
jgi:hypothetical protein